MRTLYRLVYRDGSYGAWSTNLEWLRDCAVRFGATIESKEFIDPKSL